MTTSKTTYFFADGEAEGHDGLRAILGGKGAGLAEMTRLGIPVPPGFTISAEHCREWQSAGELQSETLAAIDAAVARLEACTGKTFGGGDDPLFVSVRSGASVSMPGMMETVLNLGMNDAGAAALVAKTGDRRFVADARRRFIEMFATVVMELPAFRFEAAAETACREAGVEAPGALPVEALEALVDRFHELYRESAEEELPSDPKEQLHRAVGAVFASWDGDKARSYRRIHRLHDLLGTAVTVQAMVFGNAGEDSGTGVAFTRDPSTGEDRFYGEFLINAQGEDVVAGIRTPRPISEMAEGVPEVYARLVEVKERLEAHFGDMQDLEFTWESGRLFLLQTRTGKRSARAALRIADEMLSAGKIDKAKAVRMVAERKPEQLLAPVFDPDEKAAALAAGRLMGRGLPAGPGAAVGELTFDPDRARRKAQEGKDVLLVRRKTSPEDIEGMASARGILTSIGGLTSHAAVVARGMGKPCVVGASDLEVDDESWQLRDARGEVYEEGRKVSIDGFTGEIFAGELTTRPSEINEVLLGRREASSSEDYRRFERILAAADSLRRLDIRANADTPEDARRARALGAHGIGLCRTEHMFFARERIRPMREMILASTPEARSRALETLRVFQTEDFRGLFKAMDGLPVTIRLLDPPLHEFLPETAEQIRELARDLKISARAVRERIAALHETNPMLGHRGCRLGISHPEIYRMQARAILEAAADVQAEGVDVHPEIMIPLVASEAEMRLLRGEIEQVVASVREARGLEGTVQIGTMIEIPRAALQADRIAEHADFFSFGTNDLTQMGFGISRDDAARAFLPEYLERGVLDENPFMVLDRDGIGRLVRTAVTEGRETRPRLKLGLCGEHGGEASSIAFCHDVGLDYVSCSPYRVPIARLSAALAAIQHAREVREAARVITAEQVVADRGTRRLISLAFEEDFGVEGDVTGRVVPRTAFGRGVIRAKQAGVVCGLPVAAEVFRRVDASVRFEALVEDGARVEVGDTVARIEGRARAILKAERTALNFLQRLSGMASLTRRYVDAVGGHKARLMDTRKTIPGWRLLSKYAVATGGGVNHRMGLYDQILIKDNHLAIHGGEEGLARVLELARREAPPGTPVEVEVTTREGAAAAAEAGADIIMLDNMAPAEMSLCVADNAARPEPRPQLEASGGITLETVEAAAATGVDRISVGALTHSALALDLSLLLDIESVS